MATTTDHDAAIFAIERPHRRLLVYYVLSSLLWGPAFFVILAYRAVRYRSLRYRFDGEGISMSWGILFRREIHLTYSRIQDIHLTRGIVERYLDLARIQIQTASGKAGAEMTIEGLLEYEQVRDFLYSRMRGLRDAKARGIERDAVAGEPAAPPAAASELTAALGEVAAALREVRELLERQGHGARGEAPDG